MSQTDSHHDHHDHQDHSHGHAHGHGGHHHHGVPADHTNAFTIAIALNTVFVAIEFTYGYIANSTALMADAGHNLSDVLGLLLACGAIAWEAIHRFSAPPAVAGMTVTLVALAGIAVNGLSAWLFVKGSKGDLNIRGAYLHMMADAAVSLGVVVAGIAMLLTGWYWLDPLISIAIVVVIVVGTWGLLRESVQLALNAVPANIESDAIAAYLRERAGVTDIHDLHIWGMSTTESALTVHMVMPDGYPGDAFMDEIMGELKARFSIHHSTLQIEQGTTDHSCILHS